MQVTPLESDLGGAGERAVLGRDLAEAGLGVADQVELVDRQRHMADPEQRDEIGVPAGLGKHSLARVDEQHRAVGVRGAGDHVAGVLLVPGRVGDDELPPLEEK